MDKLEFLYNKLDKATKYIKDEYNLNYLESITKFIELFFSKTNDNLLNEIFNEIKEESYDQKIIRQAMLFLFIKAFNEDGVNNIITPDKISYLFVFLINKLFNKTKSINILDPLVGTGNLLTTIINEISNIDKAMGVDFDYKYLKLAEANIIMQNIFNVELYYQNIFSFKPKINFDLIISDIPSYYLEGEYFPYKLILYLKDYLVMDGSMILLINEDFFKVENDDKKAILENFNVSGMISLPNDLFKNQKKAILILKKTTKKEKAFIVEFDSFNDVNAFNKNIIKINEWFERKE